MREIGLFVEDYGHQAFIEPLIRRLAGERRLPVRIRVHSATGGFGQVEAEFRRYVDDLMNFREGLPDLIVVAEDANCTGFAERRKRLRQIAEPIEDRTAYAVPDPHIERWMLLDPSAFKAALGEACQLPDQKCDRGRYKRLLAEAVKRAGVSPTFGGMEHAESIVEKMGLPTSMKHEDFDSFLRELRAYMRRWAAEA